MQRCLIAFLPAAALALAGCGSPSSRSVEQPASIGVGISTMGVTVEPTVKSGNKTSVRVPITFGSRKFTTTLDGVDYDVTGELGSVGVMADYYPAAGSLRFSGGLIRTNMGATGRATGSAQVGSTTYPTVDLTTSVSPDQSIAPMLSIGYDGELTEGWALTSDLGVLYVGGFTATAEEATGNVSQADLDTELQAINDELKDFELLPFFRLGASYTW